MTRPHYHVETFINGCLNDYDSGPYTSKKDAQEDAAWYRSDQPNNWRHTGPITPLQVDRWEQIEGLYILAIVKCVEPLKRCEESSAYQD